MKRRLKNEMLKNAKGSHLLARQGPALAGTRRASSVVWVFREFDTLSFLRLSCRFAIFLSSAITCFGIMHSVTMFSKPRNKKCLRQPNTSQINCTQISFSSLQINGSQKIYNYRLGNFARHPLFQSKSYLFEALSPNFRPIDQKFLRNIQ